MNKKYIELSNLYKEFAKMYDDLDFSETARQEFFEYESTGKIDDKRKVTLGIFINNVKINGFFVGKRWVDVQVQMWYERLNDEFGNKYCGYGWLPFLAQLYTDKTFPRWWLNKVFKEFFEFKDNFYKEQLSTIPYKSSKEQIMEFLNEK